MSKSSKIVQITIEFAQLEYILLITAGEFEKLNLTDSSQIIDQFTDCVNIIKHMEPFLYAGKAVGVR